MNANRKSNMEKLNMNEVEISEWYEMMENRPQEYIRMEVEKCCVSKEQAVITVDKLQRKLKLHDAVYSYNAHEYELTIFLSTRSTSKRYNMCEVEDGVYDEDTKVSLEFVSDILNYYYGDERKIIKKYVELTPLAYAVIEKANDDLTSLTENERSIFARMLILQKAIKEDDDGVYKLTGIYFPIIEEDKAPERLESHNEEIIEEEEEEVEIIEEEINIELPERISFDKVCHSIDNQEELNTEHPERFESIIKTVVLETMLLIMESKICTKCNHPKSYTEFYKQKNSKDGYTSYCKLCTTELNKNYYQKKKNQVVTQDQVRDLFIYDPEQGDLYWKESGKMVEGVSNNYRVLYIEGKQYYAHRIIWLLVYGYMPEKGIDIDHENGDKLDNSLLNLRKLSRSDNVRNNKGYKTSKLGITGVHQRPNGRYIASITVDYKYVYIGSFGNLYDACVARVAAEKMAGYQKSIKVSSARQYIKENK